MSASSLLPADGLCVRLNGAGAKAAGKSAHAYRSVVRNLIAQVLLTMKDGIAAVSNQTEHAPRPG
jgi:hypothetical protein